MKIKKTAAEPELCKKASCESFIVELIFKTSVNFGVYFSQFLQIKLDYVIKLARP